MIFLRDTNLIFVLTDFCSPSILAIRFGLVDRPSWEEEAKETYVRTAEFEELLQAGEIVPLGGRHGLDVARVLLVALRKRFDKLVDRLDHRQASPFARRVEFFECLQPKYFRKLFV